MVDPGAVGDIEVVSRSPMVGFADVYHAEFAPLVRLATLLTGDAEGARDIVQDAFVQLHVRWHTVREPGAYARRSVINGASSHHRRRARRRTTPIADPRSDLPGNTAADRASDFDHTLASLGTLTPPERAIVVLKFYEQRSEAEIAKLVGCRVGSVGPTLGRALTKLRHEHQEPLR